MKRIVKLIAVDKRYKESSYPYRCIYDEGLSTYRTGQHINPKDPDSYDNLTVDEMTGKKMLSPEKLKRFPYVINPLSQINFFNNQQFDLSKDKSGNYVNPKDVALIDLLREEGWMVAQSHDKVVPRKHYFYIKDEIFEAQKRITQSDARYLAEKYIREEVDEDGLHDVGLVLDYKVKEFTYQPGVTTDLILKDRILELCKTKPDKVLECKEIGTEDDVYVLKLSLHNIITRRGTDFYDESKFIGKDIEDVKKFTRLEENTALVSKWNRLLGEKTGRIFNKDAEQSEQAKLYDKIKDKSYSELRRFAGVRKYPKEEWEGLNTDSEMIEYLMSKV